MNKDMNYYLKKKDLSGFLNRNGLVKKMAVIPCQVVPARIV